MFVLAKIFPFVSNYFLWAFSNIETTWFWFHNFTILYLGEIFLTYLHLPQTLQLAFGRWKLWWILLEWLLQYLHSGLSLLCILTWLPGLWLTVSASALLQEFCLGLWSAIIVSYLLISLRDTEKCKMLWSTSTH